MKYIKPIIYCTLTLFFMTVIFSFSAYPAESSSAMSSPIAEGIVELLYPAFDGMSTDDQLSLLDTWSFIVRKGAHFTEYTLLGLLLALSFGSLRSVRTNQTTLNAFLYSKLPLFAFIAGAVYASSDELHQCFVPGRSGQLSDVLLDSVGVAAGVLTICLIAKIKSACRK